ncbi:MAG TPA: right-handed parallel beta-helix repeat-containing protein [Phycisphaerae bacterium]|nr:right-handed parallel beta-helix repeat-containing protein [Phycisphaerae bacterium]
MTLPRMLAVSALVLLAWACGQGGADADAGADTDTGTEAEPDADADADADADGDTDTGPDPCSNSDMIPTFDPADCPEQEPVEECVRFVDVDSQAEEPDGLSWDTAFREVQPGIDSARCGAIVNGSCEVWVAEGRYHVYTFSRRETIELRPGVSVYGGFAGDETALEQRDFVAHEVILDGQDANDGPCHALHVVTGSDDAVLDGVTVTGGRARLFSGIENAEDGGGMLNVDASPTVGNCAFVANEALRRGGGMHSLRGSPVIHDCLFRENAVAGSSGGGGLFLKDSAEGQVPAHIERCTFIGNTASGSSGGALHSSADSVVIEDSAFHQNEAQGAGAIYAKCSASAGCELTVERCTFAENKSKQDSSAVRVQGWGDILIRGCLFHDNAGGGFTALASAPVVENCVFVGNVGQTIGAIRNWGGRAHLLNCTVHGNSAALPDGAGGVYSENGEASCGSDCPVVTNCIVRGNAPVDVKDTAGAVTTVSFSDIGGGWPGMGNIDADPLFVNASGQDFHLLGGSPCIDAADGLAAPELDFDGNERCDDPGSPNAGLGPPWADMGAFENASHLDLRSPGRAGMR